MKPFRVHTGIVAPLDICNVDTDQIIPKQFLKRIERTGFGQFLFYDWRYKADGTPDPSFVLNEPGRLGASILLAGKNFGCGSSREHAAWALSDYGFRAIIAPSFADIFANNCVKNGILTIELDEATCAALMSRAVAANSYKVMVDLKQCIIQDQSQLSARFDVNPFRRHCLLNGLDDIGLTLRYEAEIAAFEAHRSM